MKIINFREQDIPAICKGKKIRTCRKIEDFDKFKEGDIVEFKANYSHCSFASAIIKKVEKCEDITEEPLEFFKELGYDSKRAYFMENFNQVLESSQRCVISFYVFALSLNSYYFQYLTKSREKRAK